MSTTCMIYRLLTLEYGNAENNPKATPLPWGYQHLFI